MSAINVLQGDTPEGTLSSAVARRIRGYLAERRISHKEFGQMVGWDRGRYQRRLAGEVPLTLDDLEQIMRGTGLSLSFLLTGVEETPPRPPVIAAMPPTNRIVDLRSRIDERANDAEVIDEDAMQWVALGGGPITPLARPRRARAGLGGPAGEPTSKPTGC